jgi:hypothetical protein
MIIDDSIVMKMPLYGWREPETFPAYARPQWYL